MTPPMYAERSAGAFGCLHETVDTSVVAFQPVNSTTTSR
jgi:hypothetical protein